MINQNKTKYMICTKKDTTKIRQIEITNQVLKKVENFNI